MRPFNLRLQVIVIFLQVADFHSEKTDLRGRFKQLVLHSFLLGYQFENAWIILRRLGLFCEHVANSFQSVPILLVEVKFRPQLFNLPGVEVLLHVLYPDFVQAHNLLQPGNMLIVETDVARPLELRELALEV